MLSAWDQDLSTDETNDLLTGLAQIHYRRISDANLRMYLHLLIEGEHYAELGGMTLPYEQLSPQDTAAAAQVIALFSKRADIDLGIDRERVAYEKFMESERLCAETNAIFRLWSAGKFQFTRDVERVLFHAQRKISKCLGDVPSLGALKGRFGPGATTQVKKRIASPRRKLSQKFACSEDFCPLLQGALAELPGWVGFTADSPDTVVVPVEIHSGHLHFVPKNAKTDRSIVVEPALNSFFQLGVGDYIAKRLKFEGIDITDQTRNQQLARQGSVDGGLATLDLSSASDTVARELVAHLLPIGWFSFLDQLRTGVVKYKGSLTKLSKFSSMGNGFTFPLETLIFWALAESSAELTGGGIVSVYGDDIIVPHGAVDLLTQVLNACGFILNKDKSYWAGPFRESCGKDYHSGFLVRPAFVKDRLLAADIFTLHNHFVRGCDSESATYLLQALAPSLQIWGPDGYGDGHLICGSFDDLIERVRPHKRELGWSGFIFDTFTWRSRKCFTALSGDYVFPSYAVYVSDSPRGVSHDVELIAKLGLRLATKVLGSERVARSLSALHGLKDDETSHSKKAGTFGVVLPGARGYKRISIYTLRLD